MKSLFILLTSIFVLGFTSLIYSQSGWLVQNSGSTVDLYSVFFINTNTGWAAGYRYDPYIGQILKTTNGGAQWNIVYSQSGHFLSCIYFLNQNTGWITLDSNFWAGVIKKTTNGGLNWVNLYATYEYRFFTIFFIDQNTGWAGGNWGASDGAVLKSTNGGANWIQQDILPIRSLSEIQFIDNNTGWAGGVYNSLYNMGLAKTTNGGINWIMIIQNEGYNDFQFSNVNTGWGVVQPSVVSGNNFIKKTTNGGLNWITLYTNLSYENFRSVHFANYDSGWAVGGDFTSAYRSRIIATRDGGQNWIHQWPPAGPWWGALYDVYFADKNTGWSVGEMGYILKTTNGGGEGGSAVEKQGNSIPFKYFLRQNYPNPFNPSTVIEFDVPKASFVKLFVYDVIGRESAVLVNEYLKPGSYKTEWNASSYPSGVYFYKKITDGFTETKKMVLIK